MDNITLIFNNFFYFRILFHYEYVVYIINTMFLNLIQIKYFNNKKHFIPFFYLLIIYNDEKIRKIIIFIK